MDALPRSLASEPRESHWRNQTEEDRERYLKQISDDYFHIIDDYLIYANSCVKEYNKLSGFHGHWRKWTIIATGGLAAVNVLSAFELISKIEFLGLRLTSILTTIAAIYAVALTVAGNLENYFNAGEKAAGFRESRELFLTRYRKYWLRRVDLVQSFGFSPEACVNAGKVYTELVESDKDLRGKVLSLTEIQARGGVGNKHKHR